MQRLRWGLFVYECIRGEAMHIYDQIGILGEQMNGEVAKVFCFSYFSGRSLLTRIGPSYASLSSPPANFQ